MRYFSLLIIVFLMWWTWHVSRSPAVIAENTHIEIQEELKQVIKDYIESNLPSAHNVEFHKFWTETLKPDSVKAGFVYSFEDESADHQAARVGIEGYAILNHVKKAAEVEALAQSGAAAPAATPPEPEWVWSLDEVTVTSNHLVFKDGSTITKPEAQK